MRHNLMKIGLDKLAGLHDWACKLAETVLVSNLIVCGNEAHAAGC